MSPWLGVIVFAGRAALPRLHLFEGTRAHLDAYGSDFREGTALAVTGLPEIDLGSLARQGEGTTSFSSLTPAPSTSAPSTGPSSDAEAGRRCRPGWTDCLCNVETYRCEEISPDVGNGERIVYMLAFGVTLVMFVLEPLLNMCVGCMYKKSVHDQRSAAAVPRDRSMVSGRFHAGICGWPWHLSECAWSLFCPVIRVADTLAAADPSFGFWKVFALYAAILVIPHAIYEFSIGYQPMPWSRHVPGEATNSTRPPTNSHPYVQPIEVVGMVLHGFIFGIWGRNKIRAKLNDPSPSSASVGGFVFWCLCPLLAITQEAVEVDIATNVQVGCCPCDVKDKEVEGGGNMSVEMVGPATRAED